MRFRAVLFDLDGTLVDSAPDLAGAANELRALHGHGPLPLEALRPWCGSGARGMLWMGFGIRPEDPGYAELKANFLDLYAARLLRHSRVFDEVPALLGAIDRHGRPWGVVTNKAEHLAAPLLQGVGLGDRLAVLVGGDTTPHTKPHPAPLLEAARRLGVDAAECVYVGDDARDMQAGRAAGMAVVAAAWGYLGQGADPARWDADACLSSPDALLNWLDLA